MTFWVFGYGSLVWNPEFEYDEKVIGFIKDYRRVFDLACIDHRGTPESPARTCTLEPSEGAICIMGCCLLYTRRPTKGKGGNGVSREERMRVRSQDFCRLLQGEQKTRNEVGFAHIYFLHQHTIQLGQPATVKVAANLVRLLSYNNKSMLETGLIVGGWDKYERGKIYGIPLGGTIIEQPFAIGGSGSRYLYGFFDQAWKEGMTKDEAEQLVVKAVSLAIARDGASGGVVRTVIINSEGVKRNFYQGDALPLWHEELEP